MAPPPPTKLRTTKHMAAHNCAQLSTIADCFHGSRRFIFTGSCSATHGLLLSYWYYISRHFHFRSRRKKAGAMLHFYFMYFTLLCTACFCKEKYRPTYLSICDVRIRYADDPPFKYGVTFKIVDRTFSEGLRDKRSFCLHSTGDTNHAGPYVLTERVTHPTSTK